MTINILAFGVVRDILGKAVVEIPPGGITVAAFKTRLEDEFPRLKQLSSFMIAVNREYASPEQLINERDEVAIIPPVSGG